MGIPLMKQNLSLWFGFEEAIAAPNMSSTFPDKWPEWVCCFYGYPPERLILHRSREFGDKRELGS